MMLVIILFPANVSIQAVFIWSIIIIASVIYEQISGNFRKSSLYLDSRMHKDAKITNNISSILVVIFWSMFLTTLIIGYTEFFGIFDIILDDWIWGVPYQDKVYSFMVLSSNDILIIYYSSFEIALFICGMGFGLFRLFSSTKIYYNIIFILIILITICGGIFNNFFGMAVAANSNRVPSFANNKEWHLFPNSMFIPSLFFPLYGPSQHLVIVANNVDQILAKGGGNEFVSWIWLTPNNVAENVLGEPWQDIWRWNILWLQPYIWTSIFVLLGMFFSKK